MKSCLKNKLKETRRCRPLLGTFVEVAVWHNDAVRSSAAIDAAFWSIERVQGLMSFHDPESEVSRLNRLAFKKNIRVSFETFQVLAFAKKLCEATEGIFNITVADELVKKGNLPAHIFLLKRQPGATAGDIMLLPGREVRFRQPLSIDLGGIAKGFAVDQAVKSLKNNGIKHGLVNAGGDMKCFGPSTQPVWVRHPKMFKRLLPLTELKNKALATSSNFGLKCTHFDGRTRKTAVRHFSVSVRASSCMTADALTKAVLVLGRRSFKLLSGFGADTFIVYSDKRILSFEGSLA